MQNRHTQSIPPAVAEQLRGLLQQAVELAAPYAIALPPEDKQRLPKMGPKSLAFVERAHEAAQANPGWRPIFLDMTEFDADFADAHGLWQLRNDADKLTDILSTIVTLSGSEAYQQALTFYSNVKFLAPKVTGAQTLYEELRALLPLGKRATPSPPPDTP
jgi:hypothetical protein